MAGVVHNWVVLPLSDGVHHDNATGFDGYALRRLEALHSYI